MNCAITRADYRVELTPYLVDTRARDENLHRVRQELEGNIAALLDSSEWMVAKQSHGQKGKTVNARPAVAVLTANAEGVGVRLASRLQATGYLRPDLLFRSLLPSLEFDPRLLLVRREGMWVERGGTLRTPLEALEDSAFWRPVPVDPSETGPSDPPLEVNAPRNHH